MKGTKKRRSGFAALAAPPRLLNVKGVSEDNRTVERNDTMSPQSDNIGLSEDGRRPQAAASHTWDGNIKTEDPISYDYL